MRGLLLDSPRAAATPRTPRIVRTLLACVLVFSMLVPVGLAGAAPSGGQIVWDSQDDFRDNASAAGGTTTVTGVSLDRAPGSVMLPGPVKAVAAGFTHTVGLSTDGSVVAVGQNDFGQIDVSGWSDIATITCGYYNTYGLTSSGTAVAVGYNSWGQLNVSGWADVVAVAAGFHHAVGLKSDGTVVAAGSNDNGTGQSNVSGWTGIVAVAAGDTHTVGLKSDGTVVQTGSYWGDLSGWTDIVAIAAGSEHTVGLKSDGTVVAVGSNLYGECDVSGWMDITAISTSYHHTVGLKSDGTLVAVGEDYGDGRTAVTSMDHIQAIAAGGVHTVGIDFTGSVRSVGSNSSGQRNTQAWCDYLALAAGDGHSVGLQSDGTAMALGNNDYGQTNVSAWADVVSVDAGTYHTVGVNDDGTVTAVGDNINGQIGVNAWTDIVAASAGGRHTVGLKSDGTAVGVGNNTWGALSIAGWSDLVAVTTGDVHTVGLRRDGTVLAAGTNNYGELSVSGWSDCVAVSAGNYHTVGLKSDGTVIAVGLNDNGQCDVSGWTDIVRVSAGQWHTVGLKSDGTVVATGLNASGQCDVSSWTDVVDVVGGGFHTLGLAADGSVLGVGYNGNGETETSTWASLTPAITRVGSIGGTETAVGLRAQAPSASSRWTTLSAATADLLPFQAVKFAVRTSDDGATWSEPLGYDGDPIDWTTGTGNYLGRAATDSSARTDLGVMENAEYLDIVVRLETQGVLSPELKSVTLDYVENSAPVAVDDDATCDEDTSVSIYPLSNDTDADGDTLTLAIVDEPANGTAELQGSGEVVYTPYADWSGTDTFTYYANDGKALSNLGTVTITVNEVIDLPPGANRVSGPNRYATAIKASNQAYPDGAGTVVLATGANWPDALGGSALAGVVDGPLLLTGRDSLPAEVVAEIARLKATKVYILGGTAAVGTTVEQALNDDLGASNVDRLDGTSRYETARKVADEVIRLAGAGYDGVAYVATGANFPDALAVSPVAAAKVRPVLLADPRTGSVSRPTAVTDVYILGGTSAVSAPIETALNNALGDAHVDRVSGANRYATGVEIAKHGVAAGLSWNGVGVATGTNFPDGLSGGAMLGRLGTVMLLTRSDTLAPEVNTVLEVNSSVIQSVFIIGGTSAVSPAVEASVKTAAGL